MESFRESFLVLYNLLVTPVKNPPVATNTTRPCSTPTFLSSVSLSFLLQLGFYCRHWLTHSSPWVTSGTPAIVSGTPEPISGLPEVISGVPEIISGTPEVIPGRPEIISGRPELTSGTPWVAPWGRYFRVSYHFVVNQHILLNKQSLFNTLNLQSWLIS